MARVCAADEWRKLRTLVCTRADNGWPAPFGAPPPSFISCLVLARGGWHGSGAQARRENDFVYPPPRSGGGGPRVCAVEGASAWRLFLESHASVAAAPLPPPLRAVPLPRFAGQDDGPPPLWTPFHAPSSRPSPRARGEGGERGDAKKCNLRTNFLSANFPGTRRAHINCAIRASTVRHDSFLRRLNQFVACCDQISALRGAALARAARRS